MDVIVSKFGGTSVADATQLRKVQRIVHENPKRRVIVVSAPGKRTPADPKVTDLCYRCHELAEHEGQLSRAFEAVRTRYLSIQVELGLSTNLDQELSRFENELKRGCSRDYAASRGEYLSAILVAALLGAEFIDPLEYVRIADNGTVDSETYALLQARFAQTNKLCVMPGFYGADRQGNVRTFSRGGSDVSGAIAARSIGASLYENWTDVPGLLMADPRIVDNPKVMGEVTYREVRELSYMGAGVFHDEAMLPLREAGIPIAIKNTNDPSAPGTRIVARLSPEVDKSTEIAGIAGKQGFSLLCLDKTLMNKEIGFAHHLLGIFARRNISVEHCPSSIDGITVIVESASIQGQLEAVMQEIRDELQPDRIVLERELALIAIVGEGMARTIGIAAKVFQALSRAGVNVRVIDQGASELNIIVGVAPGDFKRAVQALYAAFV